MHKTPVKQLLNVKTRSLRLHFATNLRREREALGLSQQALAHLAGLHRTYIGRVERGERNVSIDNIQRLAEALGVAAAELMRTNAGGAGGNDRFRA